MTFSPRAIEAAAEAYAREACEILYPHHIDRMRAALSAALAVDGVALQGWQPIDSAPKDGTPVLGFMPKYFRGKGGHSVILWLDMEWSDMGAHPCDPSHWMPLPPPPAASDREERR